MIKRQEKVVKIPVICNQWIVKGFITVKKTIIIIELSSNDMIVKQTMNLSTPQIMLKITFLVEWYYTNIILYGSLGREVIKKW